MNYTFTFTEAEANTMLQALASRPYAEVAGLISNIQRQVQTQAKTVNTTEPPQE